MEKFSQSHCNKLLGLIVFYFESRLSQNSNKVFATSKRAKRQENQKRVVRQPRNVAFIRQMPVRIFSVPGKSVWCNLIIFGFFGAKVC